MAALPLPAPNLNPVSSAWNYIKGQCTYYAAQAAAWIPPGLGNAADWLSNARLKGFNTSSIPTVGSVVVYGRGNGYDPANGHVAVVESVLANGNFTVGEQNFDERGSVQHGRVSTMADVLGFIQAPGSPKLGNASSGSGNLNPLDIPGAIGKAVAAIGQTVTQIAYLLVGLVLFGFGMVLLLKAEGIKTPSVPSLPIPGTQLPREASAARKPVRKPAQPEPDIEASYARTGRLP